MRILTSNDDGIHAPGLKTLVGLLKTIDFVSEVVTVAPDRDRSGASNSLTIEAPLRVTELSPGRACVNGTPTDCVHLAITGWMKNGPDMVISGINDGANLGDDILYSGTVAAAMEGRFLGYPSIAVSLSYQNHNEKKHFETAAEVIRRILSHLQHTPLPRTSVLNINVPNVPLSQIRGIRVTRLGHRHRAEPIICSTDPRGREVFWVGPAGQGQDAGPGTDFHAIAENYVSLTPLQADLTHYDVLEALGTWSSAFALATDL